MSETPTVEEIAAKLDDLERRLDTIAPEPHRPEAEQTSEVDHAVGGGSSGTEMTDEHRAKIEALRALRLADPAEAQEGG